MPINWPDTPRSGDSSASGMEGMRLPITPPWQPVCCTGGGLPLTVSLERTETQGYGLADDAAVPSSAVASLPEQCQALSERCEPAQQAILARLQQVAEP